MRRKVTLNLSIEEAQRLISKLLQKELHLDSPDDSEVEVIINPAGINVPIDIGIVIALDEEFREIFPLIEGKPFFNEEISQYYYLFERGDQDHSRYRCVVTFMGGMGTGKAALAGDRLIHQFKPATIVNLGIAGSMDSYVKVGDVVVAEQADDYLYAAKAIAGKKRRDFDFLLSGDPYKSSPEYVKHAQNLKYAHPGSTKNWLNVCAQRLQETVTNVVRERLLRKELISEHPQIYTGNIASGPIVGATDLFVKWLRDRRDRKYLALEMEAAGVMSAAYTRSTDTLIIRGISDYSDERKVEFDRIGKGALRRYAMNNAIALLWTFMDLQLIKSAS